MNARTQFQSIESRLSPSPNATLSNPVVRHLQSVQGQLEVHVEHLNQVVVAMQRINEIMAAMAAKRCKLNRPYRVE